MPPFEIEKGVPLPEKKFGNKYPFAQMEVGDSVLIPFEVEGGAVRAQDLRARLSPSISRLAPRKFATRRVEGGIRVWRLE